MYLIYSINSLFLALTRSDPPLLLLQGWSTELQLQRKGQLALCKYWLCPQLCLLLLFSNRKFKMITLFIFSGKQKTQCKAQNALWNYWQQLFSLPWAANWKLILMITKKTKRWIIYIFTTRNLTKGKSTGKKQLQPDKFATRTGQLIEGSSSMNSFKFVQGLHSSLWHKVCLLNEHQQFSAKPVTIKHYPKHQDKKFCNLGLES